MMKNDDIYWMQHALNLAHKAKLKDEVPVGAVLIMDNQIIAEGHNNCISNCDPTAHAEIVALRNAAQKINNYRILNSTLYVTLEPCVMCCGAIINSRVMRLVYGASDAKSGGVESKFQVMQKGLLNHHVACEGGILADDCVNILQQFFQNRRNKPPL